MDLISRRSDNSPPFVKVSDMMMSVQDPRSYCDDFRKWVLLDAVFDALDPDVSLLSAASRHPTMTTLL